MGRGDGPGAGRGAELQEADPDGRDRGPSRPGAEPGLARRGFAPLGRPGQGGQGVGPPRRPPPVADDPADDLARAGGHHLRHGAVAPARRAGPVAAGRGGIRGREPSRRHHGLSRAGPGAPAHRRGGGEAPPARRPPADRPSRLGPLPGVRPVRPHPRLRGQRRHRDPLGCLAAREGRRRGHLPPDPGADRAHRADPDARPSSRPTADDWPRPERTGRSASGTSARGVGDGPAATATRDAPSSSTRWPSAPTGPRS